MKISADKRQGNVCKEEVLMCIFKDVATNNPDEEVKAEDCWLLGSHQDVLVGKQSAMNHNSDATSTKSADKIVIQKRTKKTLVDESKSELEIWSSMYSNEQLPAPPKLPRKIRKLIRFSPDCALIMHTMMSSDSLKPMVNLNKIRRYKNPEELCDDCRWLVKAAESLDHLASSGEEEDPIDEIMQSSSSITKRSPSAVQSDIYKHRQVMKTLDQVQSILLECCILITTQKLHRKVRTLRRTEETPNILQDSDLLLDESEDVSYSQSTSKLSQDLGRLVTRYLKVNNTRSSECYI